MSGFAHLLTDTVTYKVPTGVDGNGDPTYGAAATVKARVEYGTKTVINAGGTERQCEAVIVTEAEFPHDARIWLPGENTADASAAHRPILTKRAGRPGGGLTLCETYL